MPNSESSLPFETLTGLNYRPFEPMRRHVPLRVGGKCLAWIRARNLMELKQALKFARQSKLNWKIHWPFEDWIVKDHGFYGVIIRLCGEFESIEKTDQGLLIGTATLWPKVSQYADWLMEMKKWPGAVGSVFSNDQAHCLKGYHLELEVLKGARLQQRLFSNKDPIPNIEKGAIPLKVHIKGRRIRKRPGPKEPGLIFEDMGKSDIQKAIKTAAASSVRLRDWRISTKNNGQVANLSHGRCDDLLLLAKGLQDRIKKTSGKRPDIRIPIIGSHKRVQ